MKKIFLAMALIMALVQLSSCSKKSSDSATDSASYGDLPSQLATDAY